jgi:4-hydroxybenzoyl-CoA thioesterase
MAYTHRRTVRFDEVDFARVVYYPRFFEYCHQAFEEFFAAEAGVPYAELLQARAVAFPTVQATANYVAPLRFGDAVRVVMETLRVGRSSVTCRYRLFRADDVQPSAEVEVTTVAIDVHTFESREIPDDLRAAFVQHRALEA